MDPDYKYTVEDVGKMVTVEPETVRRWCRERKIKFIRLPGKKGGYRFCKSDIIDFLAGLSDE